MGAPKQQFPLVRWAVIECSYDDIGTQVYAVHSTRRSRLILPLAKIAGTLSRLAIESEETAIIDLSGNVCRGCAP
jgi:hypothetical protein